MFKLSKFRENNYIKMREKICFLMKRKTVIRFIFFCFIFLNYILFYILDFIKNTHFFPGYFVTYSTWHWCSTKFVAWPNFTIFGSANQSFARCPTVSWQHERALARLEGVLYVSTITHGMLKFSTFFNEKRHETQQVL